MFYTNMLISKYPKSTIIYPQISQIDITIQIVIFILYNNHCHFSYLFSSLLSLPFIYIIHLFMCISNVFSVCFLVGIEHRLFTK